MSVRCGPGRNVAWDPVRGSLPLSASWVLVWRSDGRKGAGRKGAGGAETDPDTRTEDEGRAGDGQERGQSKGNVLARRFSWNTADTCH